MTRNIFIFGFAAGIVGLVVACSGGGDSSSSGGANNGNSSGTSGSPGTSSGSSGSSSNDSKFKTCPSTTGTTCTEAEMKPYTDCLLQKCDAEYAKCYGADFKNGSFSGACGTWMTCVQKCACGDTQCILKCEPDEACQTCVTSSAIDTCGDSCTEPACSANGTPDDDAKTCADLEACCDGMTDAGKKQACEAVVGKGDDAQCGSAYTGFKGSADCP